MKDAGKKIRRYLNSEGLKTEFIESGGPGGQEGASEDPSTV